MGHAATRCPDFNDSFPFLQPGWQKEKTRGFRPLVPGGGAVSTVSPQQMRTDDVFQTVEQSGGGSLMIHPRASADCTERIIAEDTPGRAR